MSLLCFDLCVAVLPAALLHGSKLDKPDVGCQQGHVLSRSITGAGGVEVRAALRLGQRKAVA